MKCRHLLAAALLFWTLACEAQKGPFTIRIVPQNPNIPQGGLQTLYIERVSIGGHTQGQLLQASAWSSSNPAVATIDPSTGFVTTVAQGITTISVQSGPYFASTQIRVAPIALVSIVVTPANLNLNSGMQQYTATGFYSSGPSQDLTAQAAWSSSNPAVATITASGGLLTVGAALGTTTVTAKLNGVTGATTLNVGLKSMALTPTTASIAVTQRQPFTALGTFTDNSVSNISSAVNWGSNNLPIAVISSQGVATGVSTGSSQISASSGTISSPMADLTVVPLPTLTSVTVAPANPGISLGATLQLSASGHYSDGSSTILATPAWFSTDSQIVAVDAKGNITGVGLGSATITAIQGSLSGSALVTVNPPPTLTSITVLPASAVIGNGKTQQFQATGLFSDGSIKDLTEQVTWGSSNTSAAVISNTGLAGAVGAGKSTITAGLNALMGTATLQALAAPRFAYVVNNGDNTVSTYALNAATGIPQSMGYTLTGPSPTSIAVDQIHNFAWVANSGVTGTGAFNTMNITTGTFPDKVGVNPTTNMVYVATGNSVSQVSVINGANNTVVATLSNGSNPQGIGVNSVSNKIYVPNQNTSNVTVIDGSTNTVATTIPVGNQPDAVAVDSGSNTIYVANYGNGNVSQISGTSDTVGATTTVGTGPVALAFDSANNDVYSVNQNSNDVTVFNSVAIVTTLPVGLSPRAIAVNAVTDKLYVVNSGGNNVSVIDGATNTVTATVSVGTTPMAVAVNTITNQIYVANNASASVTVIDGATNNTTPVALPANSFPSGVAVDETNNKVYVANEGTNNVTVIDGATNSTTTVAAGSAPIALAFDPANGTAYVANNNSSNVTAVSFSPSAPANDLSAYSVDPQFGVLTPLSPATVPVGNTPSGVAVDAQGRFLYAVNNGDGTLSSFTINAATGALTAVGPALSLAAPSPFAVFIEPQGRFLYITYESSNLISGYAINQSTGALTPIPGSPFTAGDRANLAIDPTGTFLYSPDSANSSIDGFAIDQTTGMLTPTSPAMFAAASQVNTVTLEPSGRFLYATVQSPSEILIYQIDPDGTLTPGTPPSLPFGGNGPTGALVDPSGRFIFVGEQGVNQVGEGTIDPNTGQIMPLTSFISRNSPVGGVITGGAPLASVADFAYIANAFSNDVSAFAVSPSSGGLTTVAGSPFPTGGQNNNGQCAPPGGNNCNVGDNKIETDPAVRFAYLVNYQSLNISAFSVNRNTGTLTTLFPPVPLGLAAGNGARSSTIDPSGRFLWAGAGNDNDTSPGPEALYGFAIDQTTGGLSSIGTVSLSMDSNAPRSVVFDPSGQYFFVLQNSVGIAGFSVDPATGALTPVPGSPFALASLQSPQLLTINPMGTQMLVPDKSGLADLFFIDPNTGALTLAPGSPFPLPANARQFVFDATGNFAYLAIVNDKANPFTASVSSYALSPNGSGFTALGQNISETGFVGLGTAPDTPFVYANNAFLPTTGTDNIQLFTVDPTTGLLAAGNTVVTGGSGSLYPKLTGIYSSQAAHLLLINLTPPSLTVPQGVNQQFTATGVLSDGSVQNLTAMVLWSSSNPAVATVDSRGRVIGLNQGSAIISATYQGSSGTAAVNVTSVGLQGINVNPVNPTLPTGNSVQFTAMGSFTDGSTQDITGTAVWTSSNQSAATVTALGLVTTAAAGSANITATSGIVSGTSALTVSAAAVLQSIAVTPASPAISLGASLQFKATGTFSDSSTQDLTASVTWSSDAPAIAIINAAGLASSVGSGTAHITAALGAVTSVPATLTVQPHTLVSLSISPRNSYISAHHTLQFKAVGTFSDGTTSDITTQVNWTSSNTNVVTIDANGLATGVAFGPITIKASLNGANDSTTLTGIF